MTKSAENSHVVFSAVWCMPGVCVCGGGGGMGGLGGLGGGIKARPYVEYLNLLWMILAYSEPYMCIQLDGLVFLYKLRYIVGFGSQPIRGLQYIVTSILLVRDMVTDTPPPLPPKKHPWIRPLSRVHCNVVFQCTRYDHHKFTAK